MPDFNSVLKEDSYVKIGRTAVGKEPLFLVPNTKYQTWKRKESNGIYYIVLGNIYNGKTEAIERFEVNLEEHLFNKLMMKEMIKKLNILLCH